MPPKRRAQGPPSSPPALPPPRSRTIATPPPLPPVRSRTVVPSEALPDHIRRQRKMSARARAAQDETHHKTIDPPAPNTIPGRPTPQQRHEYAAHLKRKADAAQRVRDQDQQEQARFDADVAQFGQDGALRRRLEEIEARRRQDAATTSEVDELEYEDQIANPMLDVKASLRVNKTLEWSSSLGLQTLKNFSILEFEETLIKAIEHRDGFNKGWKILKYTAILRGTRRGPRIIQSFDETSEVEWERVVAAILQEKTDEMDVNIEVTAEVEKTPRKPVDEPIVVDRLTRTDQLLNRAQSRANTLADAGNFGQQLMDHWQCRDARCHNEKGWCFVDYNNKHYDVDHTQQRKWAMAISNGEPGVSIYRPPTELYQLWVKEQGSVTSLSRRSIKKEERDRERELDEEDRHKAKTDRKDATDWMSQFMAFQEQTMKMRMAESMANMMEKQQEREDKREEQRTQQRSYAPPPPPPPPPSYPRYPESAYTPAPVVHQAPQSAYTLPPAANPPSLHHTLGPVPPPPPPNRNSSPIDIPNEEGKVIDAFFEWKKSRVEKNAWKNRIAEVQRIADDNMWSIDDLKTMADPSSIMYRIAIQMGVPDAMARGFKADLKAFKPEWKQVKVLMDLGRPRGVE